jgi:hypothetical protein
MTGPDPGLNAYEQAADRFNRISASLPGITDACQQIIAWAEDECDTAAADLARYETSPGIPLPQYRPGYHEHWRPGQPLVKHCHAAGRTPHEHTPVGGRAS